MKRIIKPLSNLTQFLRSSKPAFILFLEIVFGITITIISIFIFIKIRGEVLEKDLAVWDMRILSFFYNLRSPYLDKFMVFISYFGGEIMIGLGIIVTIVLTIKKHKREAFLCAFILVMAGIIDTILKSIVQRPRPDFHPLITARHYSFPSGHAMDSFVFYTSLSYFIFHFSTNKKPALIACVLSIVVILLIGTSRIYLGVHYPTDVIAGYIGGLAWFTSVILIQRTLIFYRMFKEKRPK